MRQALRDARRRWNGFVLPGGAVLFREGEDSDSLYILISGRLRVAVATRRRAHSGELGEARWWQMGVLTGEERSTLGVRPPR